MIDDPMNLGFAETSCLCEWPADRISRQKATLSQAGEIRNHVPLTRNVLSGDGDAITPIEELSWGRVSRRMCCRYINHLVTVGTPCHVTQKPEATAGSDNTVVARHKPGIAYEMIGDMPAFSRFAQFL
jgi:hypothetical protein